MNTVLHVRDQLKSLQLLPPLPVVAHEVLRVFADADASLDDVERVISLDPALLGRVIGLANSSYYGKQGRIFSARDAVTQALGLDMVKNLALSIALARNFRLNQGHLFNPDAYWLQAVSTAKAAVMLAKLADSTPLKSGTSRAKVTKQDFAEGFGKDWPAQAYLAGLLQRVGILAMAHLMPDDLDQILQAKAIQPDLSLDTLEMARVGVTHQQMGLMLAEKWHLPVEIHTVIAQDQQDDYHGMHWELVTVARAACILTECVDDDTVKVGVLAALRANLLELGVKPEQVLELLPALRKERAALRLMALTVSDEVVV